VKLINGVSFIPFMYKIFIYCLSKARLGVLKVSLCVYLVLYLAFLVLFGFLLALIWPFLLMIT